MRIVTCLVLAILLLAPAAARAQDALVARSFDQLRLAARLGDTITVTEASGETLTGKLAALSPSELTLLVGKSERDLAEADVRAITRNSHANLARGARWGFAIGGGLGLLAGLSLSGECRSCDSLIPAFTITYASFGAGFGVGVAAITSTHSVIYSAPGAARRRVGVSPIVAPDRRGAALSLSF
jgi:hypothetical protein